MKVFSHLMNFNERQKSFKINAVYQQDNTFLLQILLTASVQEGELRLYINFEKNIKRRFFFKSDNNKNRSLMSSVYRLKYLLEKLTHDHDEK